MWASGFRNWIVHTVSEYICRQFHGLLKKLNHLQQNLSDIQTSLRDSYAAGLKKEGLFLQSKVLLQEASNVIGYTTPIARDSELKLDNSQLKTKKVRICYLCHRFPAFTAINAEEASHEHAFIDFGKCANTVAIKNNGLKSSWTAWHSGPNTCKGNLQTDRQHGLARPKSPNRMTTCCVKGYRQRVHSDVFKEGSKFC